MPNLCWSGRTGLALSGLLLAAISLPALASPQQPDLSAFMLDPPAHTLKATLPQWLPPLPHAAVDDGAARSEATGTGPDGVRRMLADFAMTLRHVRYRRGGREPSTGFDCSGFVRYVFHKVLGNELPADSASQFRSGERIARDAMQTGDLVFFRTEGKRISHVGIYLDDGRFIHSPSSGKNVSISRLDESYWARRFAGARRPEGLG